ncbi:uncharacterized protein METZ01_LOCUS466898 [marine metagenome]|uniref:Uncharacterized protein n=1 Tax=marine metagenome TaxID=408172 RepID=A0A383B2E4_9ZZZZ
MGMKNKEGTTNRGKIDYIKFILYYNLAI